ncbi:MAG TPA: UDP-2,3-diacylglucosamine diphosphatase LpxI [Thermodesulfobacteriota bacterium]|nr:UDP-2,3-diacylglucosamine diphosphatase LpxI [Thermodesulfobacteriota bacterium]
MKTIGLIAGNGRFPLLLAQTVKKQGRNIVAVAHEGQTLSEISQYVDKLLWIKVGQLSRMISFFKEHAVKEVVLAGGINKSMMFTQFRPDFKALLLLSKLKSKNDDSLLRAFAREMEKEGFTVVNSTAYLSSLTPEPGCLTRRSPTEEEQKDIEFGWKIAKGIGEMDIGQCVVVKNQTVLAVEAIEGTDETIRRGGSLAGKGGIVVVKVSKPNQDIRFDAPAIGPKTIRTLKEAGATVLAVEADKTIILDQEEMIKLADDESISIIAL